MYAYFDRTSHSKHTDTKTKNIIPVVPSRTTLSGIRLTDTIAVPIDRNVDEWQELQCNWSKHVFYKPRKLDTYPLFHADALIQDDTLCLVAEEIREWKGRPGWGWHHQWCTYLTMVCDDRNLPSRGQTSIWWRFGKQLRKGIQLSIHDISGL
jgi:hypothetical protein